jgi:hypothetical protein
MLPGKDLTGCSVFSTGLVTQSLFCRFFGLALSQFRDSLVLIGVTVNRSCKMPTVVVCIDG